MMRKLSSLHLVLLLMLLLPGCLNRSLTFQIRFQDLSGLQKNDIIYFQDNKVGLVHKVSYTKQGDYLADVSIKPEFVNTATVDSRFYIIDDPTESDKKAINIVQPVAGGKVLERGSVVQGSTWGGFFHDLLNGLTKHLDFAAHEGSKNLEKLKESLRESSIELDKQLESSLAELSDKLDSMQQELEKVPVEEEVRQIEKLVQQLIDELNRAEESVRLQIKDQWLPYLREELDRLRERMKRQGKEREYDRLQRQLERLNAL